MESTEAMRDDAVKEQAVELPPKSQPDLGEPDAESEPELELPEPEAELEPETDTDTAPTSLEGALPPPLTEAPAVESLGSPAVDRIVAPQVGDEEASEEK